MTGAGRVSALIGIPESASICQRPLLRLAIAASVMKQEELERYRLAFQYLSAQALDLESSAALIRRISKEP